MKLKFHLLDNNLWSQINIILCRIRPHTQSQRPPGVLHRNVHRLQHCRHLPRTPRRMTRRPRRARDQIANLLEQFPALDPPQADAEGIWQPPRWFGGSIGPDDGISQGFGEVLKEARTHGFQSGGISHPSVLTMFVLGGEWTRCCTERHNVWLLWCYAIQKKKWYDNLRHFELKKWCKSGIIGIISVSASLSLAMHVFGLCAVLPSLLRFLAPVLALLFMWLASSASVSASVSSSVHFSHLCWQYHQLQRMSTDYYKL